MSGVVGVSTCWLSRVSNDGAGIISGIAGIGAAAVELDYRLTPAMLGHVEAALGSRGMGIVSIHAVCPAVEGKQDTRQAERYSVSSASEDERRMAVADVIDTIRTAARLAVKNVVLHCGKTPMERVTPIIQRMYDDGTLHTPEGQKRIGQFKTDRLRSRGNTFKNLLKSLDEIGGEAARNGVDICLENRYYMEEYPNFEEMAVIFLRLDNGPIKYWHDTGHAQAQENLGMISHSAWLKEFSSRMAGVHLHDVERYTDHLAPPSGAEGCVDFSMVERYIAPGAARVLELRETVTPAQAKAGLEWLAARAG
ncbi:MAG: TIM barrel protein [Nitrospinae bacterium]|nr:TIM barrel protein [Nitrospinota bacterium]